MNCPKCGKELPIENAQYCPYCGKKVVSASSEKKHRVRTRGNGTGCVFQRGKTWTARAVIGWKASPDGSHKIPVWSTKGGFKTKKEAALYLPQLLRSKEGKKQYRYTLQQVYEMWEKSYSPRIGTSTMDCYRYAYKHFSKLHFVYMDSITATDLQECMDACSSGKRTHQNMKVTAGLIWAFALDSQFVDKNITTNLYIGKGESVQREPLTEQEIEKIKEAIGKERYADYIYCLCYLGFRPGEFLSLRKEHYKVIDGIEVLVNGSKTEAGKDRVVVIPIQVLDIIRSRLYVPGTDLLFPQYQCKRDKASTFISFKEMHHSYFRDEFKKLMGKLGIAEGKVPYSARHSYSDKLKRAEGSDKAKAGLMGHTDYAFTQSHYQSTDMDDLLEVALSIE